MILGNDFEALSGAFVGRSASEIKRKFIRENKADPAKIDALLKVHASGESDWDLAAKLARGHVGHRIL